MVIRVVYMITYVRQILKSVDQEGAFTTAKRQDFAQLYSLFQHKGGLVAYYLCSYSY